MRVATNASEPTTQQPPQANGEPVEHGQHGASRDNGEQLEQGEPRHNSPGSPQIGKPGDPTRLAAIYRRAASVGIEGRNPVVFIPGIMGSKLVETESAQAVWGDFSTLYADPQQGENRRLIALPMEEGVPLDQLASVSRPDGAMRDTRLQRLPIKVAAYRDILASVGVGSSAERATRERSEGDSFASFEFGYDWRRSLDETARKLDAFLRLATYFVQAARGNSDPVHFDIVAHSMGGLLLRYYLQYGTQLLSHDRNLPRLTWAGAERVDRAILIGTPNAGSLSAIERLVTGLPARRLIHPGYDPLVVGTMPALYQLLPRPRHRPIQARNSVPPNIYDVDFWQNMGWGLASTAREELLAQQLEGVDTPQRRRHVAIDHLAKSLRNAEAFHRALDRPCGRCPRPLHLILGDSLPTLKMVRGEPGTERLEAIQHAAGDGTVLRSSGLLDERLEGNWTRHLRSPVEWSSVMFAEAKHMALTQNRVVLDNVLFRLLEDN